LISNLIPEQDIYVVDLVMPIPKVTEPIIKIPNFHLEYLLSSRHIKVESSLHIPNRIQAVHDMRRGSFLSTH